MSGTLPGSPRLAKGLSKNKQAPRIHEGEDGVRSWMRNGDGEVIGRSSQHLMVRSNAVSRAHARVSFESGDWSVEDLGSRNATFLDDARLAAPARLSHDARLSVGRLQLAVVLQEPSCDQIEAGGDRTVSLSASVAQPTRRIHVPEERVVQLMELSRASGGSLVIERVRVDLTWLQHSAISRLLDQLAADRKLSDAVRGFVPSEELLVDLPWDTSRPEPSHVKQLVRRLRQRLTGTGLSIQGIQGRGYRVWSQH